MKLNIFKCGIALVAVTCVHAQQTVSVPGTANIFGAGHSTPPAPGGGSGGTLPPSFSLTPNPGQVLTIVSVTGAAGLTSWIGSFGADGNQSLAWPTSISSFDGISGITNSSGSGFLTGVFLGPDEPVDPAPPNLDFSMSEIGTSFLTLSPQIAQTFFIGDGLTGTGTGSQQQFIVPTNATRLYLGLADANSYQGQPGQYQDNIGVWSVTFQISTAAPLLVSGSFTNGNFQLQVTSTTNTSFGLQASPDLVTWTNIVSGFTDTNGILFLQDTNAVSFPRRFYRAVSQ